MNLIITNEFNKMDILKKLTDEKKFNNYFSTPNLKIHWL